MSQLDELLESLAADCASAAQLDDYRAHWAAASGPDQATQVSCPLCFRGGRTALLSAIAARGPYHGAACATCGNEFYWKAQA